MLHQMAMAMAIGPFFQKKKKVNNVVLSNCKVTNLLLLLTHIPKPLERVL